MWWYMYLHQLLSTIMQRDFFQCFLYQTFRHHSTLKTFSSQGQVYILHLTSILQKMILFYHQVLSIFEDPCAFSPPTRMQFQLCWESGNSSHHPQYSWLPQTSSASTYSTVSRVMSDELEVAGSRQIWWTFWDIWPLRGANYYRWVLCATMENKNTHPQAYLQHGIKELRQVLSPYWSFASNR